MVCQQPSVGMTGVLRTTVTLVHQPRFRRAATTRHLQGIRHQVGSNMITH
jgi:hypothetical protein